jgi:hypothetical protein
MLVKLTNAAEDPKGNELFLHTDWIVSVFQVAVQAGGSLSTVIYGGPLGITWNVEESPTQVQKLINTLG